MTNYATSHTLPAGAYFVGDPCYAFEDQALWMALLVSARYDEPDQRILEADAHGRSFVAAGTAYGDGTYTDEGGNDYPVDAGLIGVVPVGSADHSYECLKGMGLVTFTDEFTVSYDEGVICIGNITIDTDPREDGCDNCGEDTNFCDCYCSTCGLDDYDCECDSDDD